MQEMWKDIQGYEGYYQVSNLGRIKSLIGWNGHDYVKRDKVLKPFLENKNAFKNYKRHNISLRIKNERKFFKVHRLVAFAFLENPNNYPCINHKDSNATNNNVLNLEWCTQKQNMEHASINNRCGKVELDKDCLYDLHYNKLKTLKQISDILNVKYHVVTSNMRTYKFKALKRIDTFGLKFNLNYLRNELKTKTQKQLAEELGCTQSNICHMYKKLKTEEYKNE